MSEIDYTAKPDATGSACDGCFDIDSCPNVAIFPGEDGPPGSLDCYQKNDD